MAESVTDEQGRVAHVTGGIRLTIYYRAEDEPADGGGEPTLFHYGQRIRFRAALRLPRNYGNPGAMDTRGYLRRQGIDALGSARAAEIELLAWPRRVAYWRRARSRTTQCAGADQASVGTA